VLTIAHRLETIADYDMIMVMDQGSVAESGSPHDLLQLQNGYFHGLVDELGPEAKASFVSIAARRANNPPVDATTTAN
jgi:ABC-type glutathione transport system ATPase component